MLCTPILISRTVEPDMSKTVTIRGNVYQHACGPVHVVLSDDPMPGLPPEYLPTWDITNGGLIPVLRKTLLHSGIWTLLPGTAAVTYNRNKED